MLLREAMKDELGDNQRKVYVESHVFGALRLQTNGNRIIRLRIDAMYVSCYKNCKHVTFLQWIQQNIKPIV